MYIGGLDIGTTGCKIVIYDEKGNHIDTFYSEYDCNRRDGLHEIDLNTVWDSVKNILKESAKYDKLHALGVTSFGETFAMIDKDGNIIAPSMLYTDPRGDKECAVLIEKLGEQTIAFKTGVKPHSMFSLPKIMWIKNYLPDVFKRVYKILLVQDFIVYRLSGKTQIDYSLAQRTLAFDIKKKCWDEDIFNAAGIDMSLMSTPVPSGTVAGTIQETISNELGLNKELLIVSCCHDQIASITGAGIFEAGSGMDGIGTVECVPVVLDKIPDSYDIYRYGYSIVPHINGKYACYVLSFAGGSTLKWFRDTLASYEHDLAKKEGKNIYSLLDINVPEQPTDILVLPYFSGAATPYMDSEAKGAFIGLTFEHTKPDIYKALMEGVSYEILLNMYILNQFGIAPDRLRATGGGANSDVWLQIKADILNIPVTALCCSEAGATGTALVTGVATGIYDDLYKYSDYMVKERKMFYPDESRHKIYAKNFEKYKKLYKLIKEL